MENPGFPLILKKAQDLLVEAENLVKYLQERGLAEPDFTVRSAEHPQSREFDKIRIALTQAAEDAILLANGPVNWLRTFFCHHHDLGAWQTALRFNYFSIIPLEKPMSVKEIAEKAGMDEDRLSRVMKLLASQRCFHEVEENVYEHTSLSALIARDETIKAAISFQADEMFEAASLTATSIQKAPYQSIPEHSAFNIRFGVSPYQWYTSNPERGARFAAAMAGLAKMNNDTVELRDRFPWDSLGHQTVVDVGGGSGHISIFLAKEFPNLEFIVQDINPGMLSQGPQQPNYPEVEKRVSFMRYDFFQPQPVNTARLFLLRQIIHNYNDATSVKIFKSFIPAMEKSSASLLINDMVLPPANTEPKVEEHHLRQVDIAMLNGYAAKQRTLDEFSSLLKQADERFEVVQLHGKGVMGLIEVHLNQQH
ncbi:putative O-methyltransferase [Xylaria bambusicola]|uniref:putative O-methyltransferase n=1 Tax=Xylaria bambusicola TaxID=326684 RepID=UPI002007861B|nr:putative O-methyltransferase [Xylaria bambusicola]KAI0521825.1 putative O-methyltransferase [Xylaria bambusicola]